MVSTYTPSSLCPAGLQTVRLAACAGGMRNTPAANKKERMMRMTVPSERFLWAFVEARFGIVPNALNGASREDEPLPRIRENAHGKRRPGCWRTAYSAIFAETGFRTCGKGTQNWDCLPGPPETIILMDSRWVKRGIRVLAS